VQDSAKMKKIALLLLLLGVGRAHAGHIMGGSMTYEYVGNQTGVANQYRVTLTLEREVTGISAGTSVTAYMKSTSCGINTGITLSLEAPEYVNTASGQFACVPQQNLSFSPRTNRFSGLVTVPSGCPNIKFSYETCCRPSGITSLSVSQLQEQYIEAELNPTVPGYNSSPVFSGVPNIFQCVNNTVTIPQMAYDADGDSLHYELVAARKSATSMVDYAFGFSSLRPIDSPINNPLSIDPSTGQIEMTGASAHKAVIVVKVSEFRWVAATGAWVNVGSALREILVEFVANCQSQQVSIPLDTATGWTTNAAGLLERQLNCGESVLRLPLSAELMCGALQPSDIRLVSTTGSMLPIKRTADSCVNGLTKRVDLFFYAGVYEGTYYITSGPVDNSPVLMFCSPKIDTIGVVVVGACAPSAVIACPGAASCDTLLTTAGPFTYYSTWSDTSGAGVPTHTSRWTATNGSLVSPADGDTVQVQWLNGSGTLVLETRYGFCTDTDTLRIDQTVGLSEPRRLRLTLRPNPAEDEVWLSGVPPESEVTVFSALGQPVIRPFTAHGGDVRMNVGHLARGTYWISVHSTAGRGQISMVKL
jgi:hypothetical protein